MTASDAKDAATTPRRIRVLRTRNSSPPGDDGSASITTQPGEVQLLPVNPPARRAPKSALLLHLYVLFFAALAIGTVVVLVTSGFDLAPNDAGHTKAANAKRVSGLGDSRGGTRTRDPGIMSAVL